MSFRIDHPISFEEVKSLLRNSIGKGLILVSPKVRQIGKTQALIELSNELNIPIVAGDRNMADYINIRNNGKKIAYTASRFPRNIGTNGVLIEEGVETNDLSRLRHDGINIKGGFFTNLFFA